MRTTLIFICLFWATSATSITKHFSLKGTSQIHESFSDNNRNHAAHHRNLIPLDNLSERVGREFGRELVKPAVVSPYKCLSSADSVDVVVIQDVSNSTFLTEKTIRNNLNSIHDLFSVNQKLRLRLASFSDRPNAEARSLANGDHCLSVMSEGRELKNYREAVTKLRFSHSFAEKGGQLDALQAALSSQDFKSTSEKSEKRMIVLSTTSSFHSHGDAETFNVQNNVEKNVVKIGPTDASFKGCSGADYPTLSSLRKSLRHANADLLIVTLPHLKSTYEKLLRQLNAGGRVVTFGSNDLSESHAEHSVARRSLRDVDFSSAVHEGLEELCMHPQPQQYLVLHGRGCAHECALKHRGDDVAFTECKEACHHHHGHHHGHHGHHNHCGHGHCNNHCHNCHDHCHDDCHHSHCCHRHTKIKVKVVID